MVRKLESLASESPTLHAYLREIAAFPPLTRDDEQQLAIKIEQSGDEEAITALVRANLRFVVSYTRRFKSLGVPLLDLIHEGNLGLIEAARRFVPGVSGVFEAQAQWWVRQAVMHVLSELPKHPPTTTTAGLMAAASSGRHVDGLRIAVEHARRSPERGRPAVEGVRPLEHAGRKARGGGGLLRGNRRPTVLRSYLN
jgi:hypothetical protein